MADRRGFRVLLLLCLAILAAPFTFAQQTGSISGVVTAIDGSALPGVTVEARSTVLPQPRTTITEENGEFRLPALAPGPYTITFALAGMQTVTRNVTVLLGQDSNVRVALNLEGVSESITVTAEASLIDPESTEIESTVSSEEIQQLPVGQEYRDLIKLIPAVQYSEDAIRGPSAGGSGQDNVYQFDGVNVTLPLFGTLSAEPASHDIEQVAVVKGGAKAVDFNRAGGFLIDSVSKSGTSEFTGQVSYQVQHESLTSEPRSGTNFESEQTRDWATLSIGGPILRERLFFYGSYYRPTIERENRSNLYGEVPPFSSTRDELFGKLTYTPTGSLLIHGSYRTSDRTNEAASVGTSTSAGTTSLGEEATLDIGILEASWVINNRSFATFKFTDFANETLSRPDIASQATISTALGTQLPLNSLATQGLFLVPLPIAGNDAFNNFIAPLVNQYGYMQDGTRRGGGEVGFGSTISDNDFFRRSWQVGYDMTLGSAITHDLHVGYQWYRDEEDLARFSNGWGVVSVPGGRVNCPNSVTTCAGQPIYYQTRFWQQSLGGSSVPVIHSELESNNFEINDTIGIGEWSFNVGAVISQDTYYGQGLRENPDTLSGFEAAPGNKYKMYQIDFADQIQPRLGATWAYNGSDTLYASWSRYNPAASSLPRAASWDRNLAREIQAYFNANGELIGIDPIASSSGKLFQDDLTPRTVNEYMIGTSQQITPGWSARVYGRHRYTNHFWEDTNNNARLNFNPPPGVPRELYIEDLAAKLAQIGSGSTYVIAELDGAFTKFYEATVESDFRAGRTFLRGSYTWSQYYGNFDQDNTTTVNDAASFIGSSFIADGAGRQIWDNRYGFLRGDRPHLLKLYGSYQLPWNASAGAFALYQSGQPWETWSYEPYAHLTRSTDDTSRYAEPAGRHRTDAHYQVDLNYTQNIPIGRFNMQVAADVFNLFNRQTGYNIQNKLHSANFGTPRSFYDPRRIQLAARFQF